MGYAERYDKDRHELMMSMSADRAPEKWARETELQMIQRFRQRAIHFGALFVLSEVKVQRTEDGAVAATGGVCHLYDPWNLDDGILTPIGYRY